MDGQVFQSNEGSLREQRLSSTYPFHVTGHYGTKTEQGTGKKRRGRGREEGSTGRIVGLTCLLLFSGSLARRRQVSVHSQYKEVVTPLLRPPPILLQFPPAMPCPPSTDQDQVRRRKRRRRGVISDTHLAPPQVPLPHISLSTILLNLVIGEMELGDPYLLRRLSMADRNPPLQRMPLPPPPPVEKQGYGSYLQGRVAAM